jgi:hypothetical protein
MSISTNFNWPAINDSQFEELVLAIVIAKGAVRAEFRKGPPLCQYEWDTVPLFN